MTIRELNGTKALLNYLHEIDGGQATELEIHARAFGDAFGNPKPSVAELSAWIANCDSRGWITGVQGRFGGKMKWNINDAGEAARLEI